MHRIECDMCDMPIKGTLHLLAMLKDEVIEDGKTIIVHSVQDLANYLNDYRNSMRNIEKREICDKCYGIVMMLFNERKKALQRVTQEIKDLYALIGEEKPNVKEK